MKKIKDPAERPLVPQLACKIVEYVRRGNFPEGYHLVMGTLAKEFQVSRSPVHKALELLVQEGVALFLPNQGFFLNCPAAEIPELNLTIPPSDDEVKYYQIAGDRVRGILEGCVSEVKLRAKYSISRDRLTRILTRMSQEGWVERRPGKGWNFPPILDSVDTLEQSFRFRSAVEPAALLEPAYRVDPVLFAELRGDLEEILKTKADSAVFSQAFEIGARFHEQIVACSGNIFFSEAVQHINRLRRLIEYNYKIEQSRLDRYQDHLAILELLEAGHNQEAADLLRHHLNQARLYRRQKA